MKLIRTLAAWLVLSTWACFGAAISRADDTPPAKSPTVAELALQLDSDEFAHREEASQKLTELGAAAVPELAKTAQGPSLEASARAFAILKKFATGDNPALQNAARETLSKIAAQRELAEKTKNDSLAAAAARATEILNQSQAPRYTRAQPGVQQAQIDPFGAPLPQQAMPAIQMPRPGRMIIRGHNIGGQRVSIRVVDGTKQIDAEETQPDGQKRTVKIASDPKSGIRMEVTTTKDGKALTEKYEAKDAETLKKDHPEAAKIYEQYGSGPNIQIGGGQIHIQGNIQGGIQFGGGGIQVGPQVAPIEVDPNIEQQLRPLIQAAEAADRKHLQEIRRQLEEAQKQIRKARPAPAPLPAKPIAPPAAEDPFGE